MYNLRMRSLAQQIEMYRRKNRIEKQEMANLLGAPTYHHYYNWMKRDSIPKGYVDRARAILGQDGAISKLDAQILEKFSRLSPDDAETVLRMVDGLLADPRNE